VDREALIPAFLSIQREIEQGSYELYAEVLRRTAVRSARDIGWELDPSRSGFLPASVPYWTAFSETNQQLERLRKKFEIGIVSNIDDKLLGESRRHLRVDFDLVVTAQQVRNYKPDVSHFNECERRIGGKGGWVHIASGYETDIEPCLTLGIPVIWVNRRQEELDAEQKAPDEQVSTLREAVDLLDTN
jgi:2-haloacid dehalogenase/putative hydrolase of the HAD superfamily